MNVIDFKEVNTVYAENQPEYLQLPAHKTRDGEVISCWNLSFTERLRVLFTGKLWLQVLTFNSPLQPLLLNSKKPKILLDK